METFDKVIIVCTDETYDSIEPYYRRDMTKLGTVDDYTLYELTDILSPEEYEKNRIMRKISCQKMNQHQTMKVIQYPEMTRIRKTK